MANKIFESDRSIRCIRVTVDTHVAGAIHLPGCTASPRHCATRLDVLDLNTIQVMSMADFFIAHHYAR